MKEKIEAKRADIMSRVASFCDEVLNEEIKLLCLKLIDKMARKHNVPFLTGNPRIWAAAIVHMIARNNFLFDRKKSPSTSAADICFYFDTNTSTVSQKATAIEKLMKIRMIDPEFSTKRTLESFAFIRVFDANGFRLF
ncbi:MAG TPA: DUF6398 domain-containing protein [Candidatus Lokiarchaeia archaeon]|nr:DUF6398 domain-containing protein [Candidatus Lokiarchaeia archaeon]